MTEIEKIEAKKSGLWEVSPLSPQWTTAAVLLLIVFLTVGMYIGLNT